MSGDDERLLHRWAEGDATAGRALVDRWVGPLSRFFANKVPEHVSDLTQEVFLRSLESVERIREGYTLRSYLFGIANNVLLHHLRAQYREQTAFNKERVTSFELSRSPSRIVARRVELDLMLRGLRRIPIEQQVLLELYYWERLPVAELSAVLEVPSGTIKSRLSRARQALKSAMETAAGSKELALRTVESFDDWINRLQDVLPTIEGGPDESD